MRTLAEIDARLAEIRTAINAPDADLDALQTEMNGLLEERRTLIANGERRRTMLEAIANGMQDGIPSPNPFTSPAPGATTEDSEERTVIDTPEYRIAFFRSMMGRSLTNNQQRIMNEAAEQRSLTSADDSAGAALPTQTQNEVFRRLGQIAPLINEITLFTVPGNMTISVEAASVEDANAHTEGTEAAEAGDKLVDVNLSGYEVIKLLSISAKVKAMSISAFESWLVENLTDGIARKLESWIMNGTGADQPKGISVAQTWNANTNAIKFAAAVPTYAEICSLISLLPGAYDRAAKFLMNKKTLWQKIMPIRDDGKAPICKEDGKGGYVIMGYPVLLSEKAADGAVFLGDYKRYIGNLAQGVTVVSSMHSGFRKNMTDYRGTCIFDGKPAIAEAFVKGAQTL